ncbi:MAG: methyltransferase domain-containing protein [Myxococcota bacterium]
MSNAIPTRAEVADFTRRAMALEDEIMALYTPFNNDFRNFVDHERNRYPEYVYQASQVFKPGARIVNLGSGTNALDPLLQKMGMDACIVDDFGDFGYADFDCKGLLERVHGATGVDVHNLDFLNHPLPFEDNSVDVILSIDSLEHWYRGVRELMAEIKRVTRVGAKMMIVVPNAAHLKHRVRAVTGRSTWARFEEWYESEPFRGHVREPTMADMRKLFAINDFKVEKLEGVNIECLHRSASAVKLGADRLLRLAPTLCSHIFITGTKIK